MVGVAVVWGFHHNCDDACNLFGFRTRGRRYQFDCGGRWRI